MKNTMIAALVLIAVFIGYQQVRSTDDKMEKPMNEMAEHTRSAVFAGGCFWCTESDFEKVDGVIEAVSGYTGGRVENPTYKQVSAGGTGHTEAIRVTYDPAKVSYGQLLDVFWRHVDPTDAGGQFVDRGDQYRSAIFYASEEERQMAESSKQALAASGRFDRPVVTEILPISSPSSRAWRFMSRKPDGMRCSSTFMIDSGCTRSVRPTTAPSMQMLNTMGLPIFSITVSYMGSSRWMASTLSWG
jgi:methionine-S-sulfoxide reductase